MQIPLVDLKAQYALIKDEIDAAIARVIDNTAFVGGQEVSAFETAFAAYQGVKHCIGTASGTGAILLALKALGIGRGDEVIAPAQTFIASVEPIEQLGAKTVLVDIDPMTYTIEPTKIEAAITGKTKAIIVVHLYGQLAAMDAIKDIAQRHKLFLIEDAAQAHGAEYKGKRAGHWGEVACFSFYPGKNLGAYGDGGAVCTNDDELAGQLAKLRNHGSTSKYSHEFIGYCERLDALQAAVLAVKLKYLDTWNERRRQHAVYYANLLTSMSVFEVPAEREGGRHVYHIYCVRVPKNRDFVLKELNARGVGAGIHYPIPIHLQPAMAHYGWKRGDFPCAEGAADTSLSLPMFPELTTQQMDHIIEQLGEVYQRVVPV